MEFEKVAVNPRAIAAGQRLEQTLNRLVRGRDRLLGALRLGGRRADYDDLAYTFHGGPGEGMRRRHYDKSLRLLWKGEAEAPWSSFHDCTRLEQQVMDHALQGMDEEQRDAHRRLSLPEFRQLLDREYTRREKQALVAVLSAIGHGEAYAWLVSADLLGQVKSTGAKAALTMQVLEEAKHFVVLRELVHAFDVPVPRLSAWEYMLMESVLKADGMDKLFGMNVLVEGIALGVFGALSHLPGLEILRLFHLDESRHTGLPLNYLGEFPLGFWGRHDPRSRVRRMGMVAPAIPLVFHLEEDLAELGIDAFEFGASVIRKIGQLAQRAGFFLPIPIPALVRLLDLSFNSYCWATRPDYTFRDLSRADCTRGRRERAVEREVFGDGSLAVA